MDDSYRTSPQPLAAESPPGARRGSPDPAAPPERIGRYRVEKLLGHGGFGLVYLAHDEQLGRPVAIKVPHPHLVARPEDAAAYLAEARTVAQLDHPHIVPVFDVGSSDDHACYIVSKFIAGSTLGGRLEEGRPTCPEAADLVATLADALHYAHRRGVVHRDIKPGNILLDADGKPYVADFGLALRDENVGTGPRYAGTPAYMSPEQARGEGHRVDGRSDIFSLGVVFYQLLTGRRPFRAESAAELLDQVATLEPRPPRQLDDAIPKELERVCLKALAKRVSERYTTARDLADDLRHFLAAESAGSGDPRRALLQPAKAGTPVLGPPSPTADDAPRAPESTPPLRIVPKGLRSFDATDADFFLELVPGPRDRDGLPDSLRFWKTRVEATDPDQTFAVGLLYGPSGCGKTSLVKAGLLPHLASSVVPVYVEATPDDTEARLVKGLRRACPDLSESAGLVTSLAGLRRGGLPGGKRLLLVLDQFEQWLHARRGQENTELVQALRHCEGTHVQAVVLVRDDFWLAASRFMRELEIELVEGRNMALVDLFDPRHARKVLMAFGRAFTALPEGSLTREQEKFLDQAIAGLTEDGKIISVRLALFAEMVKGKPWTPATLKALGGMEGVGVAFLEDTFAAATAPAQHRLHQRAAQAVLKALLPESGSDIKGNLRRRDELLAASGYASRPRDFDTLLRILDSELRLITPTEADDSVLGTQSPAADPSHPTDRYYQLTHDYLVPSLRAWLTRKQKETRRGRAELLLADRAAVWNARPENRQLPSLFQWLTLRLLTRKKHWTEAQHRMMRRATRYHAVRGVLAAAAILLLAVGAREGFGRLQAHHLCNRLLDSNAAGVPDIVREMAPYRRWVDAPLRDAYAQAEGEGNAGRQLNASLALLPVDPGQVEYLSARLLQARPDEVAVLCQALNGHRDELLEPLWHVLRDRRREPDQRFRAACALARYDPDNARWEEVGTDVAAKLLTENALVFKTWAELLQPVGRRFLLPPLASFLQDERRGGSERALIATLYRTYAEGPEDFARLETGLPEPASADAPVDAREALVKRQANVAVALVVAGRAERVWPLLKHSPDPTLRSYLIERLGPGGAKPKDLVDRLEREIHVSVRRALLLSLGQIGLDRLPQAERENLLPRLLQIYRDDPDPGLHGAAEWLLRQWQADAALREVNRQRTAGKVEGARQWYCTRQGQTMVLLGPGEFWMGYGAGYHKETIRRPFAIAALEVTVEQFRQFRKDYEYFKVYAPTPDCPVNGVSWYDAAAYCNWLSEEEGLPEKEWCYLPNKDGRYAEGMQLAPDWERRSGYRLPTEAEWEYACRAGARTDYSFGETEELLSGYGWYDVNSLSRSHPGGQLKPNDWGLFDMHGNAWEWCQDNFFLGASNRVVRGGSWDIGGSSCRAQLQSRRAPTDRLPDLGFRPVRVPSGAR